MVLSLSLFSFSFLRETAKKEHKRRRDTLRLGFLIPLFFLFFLPPYAWEAEEVF